MPEKQRIISICIMFVVVSLGAKEQVPRYSPGPSPTIGDIQSECVEVVPAPRDRTDVGIGEEVACWIDPSTWHDTDICTDSNGEQTNVSDALGAVVWSANGRATVYPIVTDGSAVTLTMDLAKYDDTATVVATVRDSGTLGDDPPIQKRKVFNVKTPGGFRTLGPVEKTGNAK